MDLSMKSLSDARDSMHQLLDQMFDAFDEVPPQGTTRSGGGGDGGGLGKGDGGVSGEEDRKKSNNKHNSGNDSNNSTIKVGYLMI